MMEAIFGGGAGEASYRLLSADLGIPSLLVESLCLMEKTVSINPQNRNKAG
jgi:hypothetical protein